DFDEFRPTPNGTPYWVPDVPEDERPKKGFFFDNYNDAFEMYQLYSEKAKFNIRKAGFKYDGEDGEIPESYMVLDFVENHNHPLMNLNNMDLSKARRQLHFDNYIFIHRASLSNLVPTRDHRLKVALVGGYDKVRGTSTDYCNFKRCVTSFIGDRDAQMYGYKFIPFTGIDHHQKCVTFGAALLSDETTESFSWMLEAFLKTHKKQPPFAVTDQDGALRNAVVKMFPDSHHRLCMWHITEKLPGKVLGDLAADTKFRKDFHKLVWNVYIGPEVFEQRWDDMITRYNLHDNKWLSDMYAIRERWVPGYFKEVPMCGLMKTTSRSESSNSFLQKCATFGAALLSDETTKSFCWMLEAFLKMHKKQPPFAVIDQDSALRNAIVKMFPDSHHSLCMWHITEKLPGKVLGDLVADTNFRKDFHKLVWNVYIGPEVFEQRWDDMITQYNLHENKWLFDMYAIRERWVPGYFKEVPMCGLMKTTSRSESSNSFFQVYSHEGNTLVQFLLCFESAMEKQRYTQRVLDNASNGSTSSIFTELLIEKHACAVCTPSIFREVQHEIRKSLYACTHIRNNSEGSVETCIIRHRDKRSNTVIDDMVVFNQMDGIVTCSCGHCNRHGFLCRLVFYVFQIYGIDKIPDAYLNRHWTKNVLPTHLLDKRHRYGPCIEETDTLASQLEAETQTPNVEPNKEDLYADLLGVTVPDKVVIKTPRSIFRSKGTRRMKSAAEIGKAKTIARTNRKVPFKRRTCSACGGKGHNKATCKGCSACGEAGHHKGVCKRFPNQDNENEIDDEDEGDNEDEVDYEDKVDYEDEEYESEEE
ncbi:FAR1-related sequence 5-like protein, partial [Tanacetum coccineum]